MFMFSFSLLWSLSYFYSIIYLLFIFSIIFYVLPIIKTLSNKNNSKIFNTNSYLLGYDLYWLLFIFIFSIMLINYTWTSPSLSTWFGHLIFSSFQKNITYMISFFFLFLMLIYSSSLYFSCRELYDYILTCLHFYVWIIFLFFSNSIFTIIFLIEILSTLIFLLLVTSVFSSSFFYNNLNNYLNNYFHSVLPNLYLQSLLFFFWISLISSVNLFFFLILFYVKFFTFDLYIFEFIFSHLILSITINESTSLLMVWVIIVICIFIKCGLAPFYFWKPNFFRGMSTYVLFFYITFYYFFILLFFTVLFIFYLNEIFFYFILIINLILLIGILILFMILCEAHYIKIFLALSSILNTLFVFLAMSGLCEFDSIYF